MTEDERRQIESEETLFQVKLINIRIKSLQVTCQVTVETDQRDERYPLTVKFKHQTELASLSVPVVVRSSRVMCRTTTQKRDLRPREVLGTNSSSLILILTTTSTEPVAATLTVSLKEERKETDWESVEDRGWVLI